MLFCICFKLNWIHVCSICQCIWGQLKTTCSLITLHTLTKLKALCEWITKANKSEFKSKKKYKHTQFANEWVCVFCFSGFSILIGFLIKIVKIIYYYFQCSSAHRWWIKKKNNKNQHLLVVIWWVFPLSFIINLLRTTNYEPLK